MIQSELIKLRHELHRYPELSGSEFETVKRIRKFIENHHPTEIIEGIGGTGLAAIYSFPNEGKTITIRCELDALPIREANQFNHRSKTSGVSHKCGHDGHMTIVSGLIFWLKNQSFSSGKIVLLFQPAEETGKGAYEVLNDQVFKALGTDYLFALHNLPGHPLNNIIIAQESFSAEVQSFAVKMTGRESHAAEPDKGINPALALSEMIMALSSLNVVNPEDANWAILTPVHINMGQKSYGISPARGELHYTIRSRNSEKMSELTGRIESVLEKTCRKHQLEYELSWFEYFPAGINNPDCNSLIERAAGQNNYKIVERSYPFSFGEDFGWFSKNYKTAMFGLGAGLNTPALHSDDYDFPDEIIETGLNMFQSIISDILTNTSVKS